MPVTEVQASSVIGLLNSDVKLALKSAFGNLDCPLLVTDWCKGRSQLGDADGCSGESVIGDVKDSSTITSAVYLYLKKKMAKQLTNPLEIIWKSFSLVFFAELGDRSMFATITLGVVQSPWGVVGGAIAGHLIATFVAILGGAFLAKYISKKLRWWSGHSNCKERRLCFTDYAKPRLLELFHGRDPGPGQALGDIYGVLNQNVGIAATSGQAFPQCVFDHWDMMSSNPLEAGSQAANLMSEIHKRKGLKEQMTPLSEFEDKL
ncbi:hypothetical protein IFM89_033208 [Coptis chinensis]|uniref:GDT1 family protein n=1 Tax=Coptis chinensis TaxID=261450 RepID=A0A835IZ44_9MAGN|nr:hypothetical protein IFM89_033208 [Coptis chinensis]